MEKTFAFGTIKRRLEMLWAKSGSILVSDVANAYFLVRFSNPDDYQRASFEGPWKIYDYYFSLARWTPSFNEEEPVKSILTWVRLPKLPIHYFNRLAVTRIGNVIGRTVRLDLATTEGARARYARVCVEVDLSKPLLGKYVLDDRTFLIEYESLENICFSCGIYGHKLDSCPLNAKPSSTEEVKTTGNAAPTAPQTSEPAAGQWMTVSRRSKGKNHRSPQVNSSKEDTSSRFSALQVEESADLAVDATASTHESSGDPNLDRVIAEHAAALS
ncbi:hypothetical protein LINPERPRIM_LOCUS5067 [Linum perenne]